MSASKPTPAPAVKAPIETKVTASTAGAAIAGLILWALGTYVFDGQTPAAVAAVVALLVPAAVTFAAGWLAPHTPRHDQRLL